MWAILKLRLTQLKYDYKHLLLMCGLSVLLSFVFGSSTGGSYIPKVAAVDYDGTAISEEMIARFESDNRYKIIMTDYNNASKGVEDDVYFAAIVIDKGFGSSVSRGEDPQISLMAIESGIDVMNLEFALKGSISSMANDIKVSSNIAKIVSESSDGANYEIVFADTYERLKEEWEKRTPITVESETMDGGLKDYDSTTHSILGFMLMFSAFTIVLTIGSILDDKEKGTWNRMLASPVSKLNIIFENMIMTIVIGVFQVMMILLICSSLFGMELGANVFNIFVIVFLFVFAMSGFGFLISMIVKSQSQLSVTTPIILTSFAMLGGCMWPLEIVTSNILLLLSNFVPHRWALEALEGSIVGAKSLSQISMQLSYLGIMGIVFIGIGYVLFSKFNDEAVTIR